VFGGPPHTARSLNATEHPIGTLRGKRGLRTRKPTGCIAVAARVRAGFREFAQTHESATDDGSKLRFADGPV
jgi:hypothetical protein